MLKIYAMETGGADRHETARTLLRWKYEELWQRTMPEILLDENGKPHFGQEDCHFSISYTGGWVFCALSDSRIGLDAEKIRAVSTNAVNGVLSQKEWVQYSVSSNPTECFMQLWTLKEAFCKFTGLGIAKTKLNEVSFDLADDMPRLVGNPDLFFWSLLCDGISVSACSDFWHRPELEIIEI